MKNHKDNNSLNTNNNTLNSNKSERRILDVLVGIDERGIILPTRLYCPVFFGWLSLSTMINTFLVLFHFWYAGRQWGFIWGFCLSWLSSAELTQIIDCLISQAPSRNIQSLRKYGFSDWTIFIYQQINLIASQTASYVVCVVLCNDPQLGDFEYVIDHIKHNWMKILRRIFLALCASETAFIFGHQLLHTHPSLMKFHIFHHCCISPSYSTNLLFHPIDLMIEFSGSLICLLAVHYFLTFMASQEGEEHQVTLLITYTIFQLWYAYDHDEHMNLYHIKHHKTCDSLYSIYVHIKGDPKKNLLQKKFFTSSSMKVRGEGCPD